MEQPQVSPNKQNSYPDNNFRRAPARWGKSSEAHSRAESCTSLARKPWLIIRTGKHPRKWTTVDQCRRLFRELARWRPCDKMASCPRHSESRWHSRLWRLYRIRHPNTKMKEKITRFSQMKHIKRCYLIVHGGIRILCQRSTRFHARKIAITLGSSPSPLAHLIS